ncbi:MAG TPA: biotin--[acetyl-CoA-carboxylase] ligase [Gammaproteobacteria bacterium]|nr:biotin--[acetyl-CoA-carboxylase] ligase [Gammaproteobacteria bacterium]
MADKLSAHSIMALLSNTTLPAHEFRVIVEECLGSTNDHLMDLIKNATEPMPKTALLAEMQTSGKGRHGRSWVSVPGNILLSIYWPFEGTLEKLYGLSLVVGIAIARVLKANGLTDVQLKWPNDIYWQDRKMGGILIETKQTRPGIIDTVIGVGLNIVEMDEYAAQIGQKFVSLESALQHKIYRDKLVAQLLLESDKVLKLFIEQGFNAFIDEWKSLDAKIASDSHDMDLFAKIINAEKIKNDIDGTQLH